MGRRGRRRRDLRAARVTADRSRPQADPSLDALLVEQFLAFREKFGRDPSPDDPVIFDPNADEPVPMPYEDAEAAIVAAAQEVGIDPALIYAMQMTGMLLTDQSADLVDDDELDEWLDAVTATGDCTGRPRSVLQHAVQFGLELLGNAARIQPLLPAATGRRRRGQLGRTELGCPTVALVPREQNVAAHAEALAAAMSLDLEDEVSAVDVLDWLASTGLTLVEDEGDASVAYHLLAGERQPE